ncbi:unnamed protein product, partial [Rotaria magnacalcarata]
MNSDGQAVASKNAESGWVSWAWSYVPSVTTLFAEDDFPADVNDSNHVPIEQHINNESRSEETNLLTAINHHSHTPTPILFAGIELDRISLQY